MKSYSTSDLVRAVGDVTHAAVTEPVVITHHAKPRYVLMSIAAYERLAQAPADPRRAWRAGEAPPAGRSIRKGQTKPFKPELVGPMPL